jgi:hypothetical protein
MTLSSKSAFKLFFEAENAGKKHSLRLSVSEGVNGVIQQSTNLLHWETLTNFTSSNSIIELEIPQSNINEHLFYRAIATH